MTNEEIYTKVAGTLVEALNVDDDEINQVAGKNLVQLGADHRFGPPTPAPALQACMGNVYILGDRQIGAKRQLLEHATHPMGTRRGNCVVPAQNHALDPDYAAVGGQPAVDNIHQS